MKRLLLVLCAILVPLFAGCKRNSISSPKDSENPLKFIAITEKISLLREEAKNRGLNWKIFCIPNLDGTVEYYQADAWTKGSVPYGTEFYYEDGVRDWWSVRSGLNPSSSPEDAAFLLYQAILRPPNMEVSRRPANDPIMKRGDCNYDTVLDSDHPDNMPCKKDR